MSQELAIGGETDWQDRASGLVLLPTQDVHSLLVFIVVL